MKIRHKINHGWAPDHTDAAWAERVEREAEAVSAASAKAYAKAKARLLTAALRADREAAKRTPDKPRLAKLRLLVERRRAELQALDAEMRRSPAGSQHRGVGSHRGVNQSEIV